ncbi:MAG TPA: hypothetical protein VGL26_10100, partial [Jatrophihabitans sp.]
MGALEGIRLKLARTDEHLRELERGIASLQGRALIGEFDRDASEYVFRVEGDPPPAEWGLLTAEITHHLR